MGNNILSNKHAFIMYTRGGAEDFEGRSQNLGIGKGGLHFFVEVLYIYIYIYIQRERERE